MIMNRFLIILFFSFSLFAQTKVDSISIKKDSLRAYKNKPFFSDKDLKKIDSLLVKQAFSVSFVDTLNFVMNYKDIENNTEVALTTEILKKRLFQLNQNTPFNLAYNPALEKVINSYLIQRKKQFPELMSRAKYYFPMFEKYLDKYDIPLEMKYLAVVESALIPKIKSHAGATGLWQFMFRTGKLYDLKVSSYVDERQDPVKSTIAACEYLSRLFKVFGDWDLALAAYNSGPGNVLKAIKRSGGQKNYWNIRQYLPRETASYVPAFYATMYIFEYADEHQIYPNMPRFYDFETDTVQVKRTIGFDQISEVIGLEQEVLTFLNPSYKLAIIPFVENRNYTLRLPKHKIIDFLDREHEIYALADLDDSKREKPLPENFAMNKSIRYKVKSGDNLGKIAMKFGVRVSDLKSWNKLKTSNIVVGQRLNIFPKKNAEVVKVATKTPERTTFIIPKNAKYEVYEVKEGDSLWIISKKFDKISIDDLKKWNNIWDENKLKPGMKLKILKS